MMAESSPDPAEAILRQIIEPLPTGYVDGLRSAWDSRPDLWGISDMGVTFVQTEFETADFALRLAGTIGMTSDKNPSGFLESAENTTWRSAPIPTRPSAWLQLVMTALEAGGRTRMFGTSVVQFEQNADESWRRPLEAYSPDLMCLDWLARGSLKRHGQFETIETASQALFRMLRMQSPRDRERLEERRDHQRAYLAWLMRVEEGYISSLNES